MFARRWEIGLINQLARHQELAIEAKLNLVLRKYKIDSYIIRVQTLVRGAVVTILSNPNIRKQVLDKIGYSWKMEINIVQQR